MCFAQQNTVSSALITEAFVNHKFDEVIRELCLNIGPFTIASWINEPT